MNKRSPELADYVYVVLFNVILLFGLWCNPLFIYEELREKWLAPKKKEAANPYLSVLRRHRRQEEKFVKLTMSRNNGFGSIQKTQFKSSVHRGK